MEDALGLHYILPDSVHGKSVSAIELGPKNLSGKARAGQYQGQLSHVGDMLFMAQTLKCVRAGRYDHDAAGKLSFNGQLVGRDGVLYRDTLGGKE
jgi:hypothetical protein